jgi:Protein of unknown function (DUF1194)
MRSTYPAAAALLTFLLMLTAPTQAATEVDLALVLAVDISNSMDREEQELQRQGFVEAFRSPPVHDAIAGGALGRIAVVYMEWAANYRRNVVVPWTVIEGPESAADFASRLDQAPIDRGPRTSISGAIDFAAELLRSSGVEAIRQVIDVSGDGANNQGRTVVQARDEALAKGITINGLPIMLKRAVGYWDVAELDRYYRDCVIGGAGAFLVPVRERHHFAEAIRTKILREIAGYGDPLIKTAQADTRMNCTAGESRDWESR